MMQLLKSLASLRLTLVALVLLGAAVWYAYVYEAPATWVLLPSLLLLALNLIASVATHPAFRRISGLLVFHLGLIAIVLLVALGRLTYLKGKVELTQGEEFSGQIMDVDAGAWHWGKLDQVHFINEGFRIAYAPGVQRGQTRNAVRYIDTGGKEQVTEIGDQTPLVLSGYRFYTSPNKGFAPAFIWHPAAGGSPILGTVHLPSYPLNEYKQAREWQIPGTSVQVWSLLQFDEVLIDPRSDSEFRLPNRHRMVVRIGGRRYELQPGETIDLGQLGRLEYDGLRTWMGYTVFYDWTIHWLLLASMLTVGALGWHFWRKFAARPWNEPRLA